MTKKKKRSKRKILLYLSATTLLLLVAGSFGGYLYLKATFFADSPNTLSFEGDLHTVSFQWSAFQAGDHLEPHGAMLVPVTVPGIEEQLYMQFDTGSPSTFLLSGCLESLRERGVEFETTEKEGEIQVKRFEFSIGDNKVALNSGHVSQRGKRIDWNDSESRIKIGTIGADFIDQRICEIDFPSQKIRLHDSRPESFNTLGTFTSFKFKGRRIMLPAEINGIAMELFYDSGCSAFGFLTSKYHYDRYAEKTSSEISYNANRHGDPVFIHHKTCRAKFKFGDVELPVKRVSYAELYNFLQVTLGRVINGGFLGNKSLLDSTLIIDGISNEFLVAPNTAAEITDQTSR
jgi:hypothetical protein